MSNGRPLNSLLTLLGLFLLGTILSAILSMCYIFFFAPEISIEGGQIHTGNMRILQGIGALTQFVLPAIAFVRYEQKTSSIPLFRKSLDPNAFLIVLIITVSISPFIDQLGLWNEQIKLSQGLSPLESWMSRTEAEIEEVIRALMLGTQPLDLLGNLVVIALLAAVGEELLFRACLQSVLSRWFKSPHTAIWITAIVFSAFHLQFSGFLPRLALGVLFGYLYFWSGTIWYPIVAHFLNNAFLVTLAFIWARQGRELQEGLTGDYLNGAVLVLSIVLTTGLLYWFRKLHLNRKNSYSYEN